MKRLIKYSSYILVLCWACSDSFLEEPPRGFLSEQTLQSPSGVEAALLSAYAVLDGHNDGNNNWTANPFNWIFGSVPTDDAYKGSEQTDFPEMTQLEIYTWTAGNAVINAKWVMSYEGIVRANSVLKILPQAAGITDADAKRIEGEARFLRAYYHFELYKVWGNIPYFTEEDVDFIKSNEGVDPLGSINNDPSAPSVINDLKAAVELLPEVQADRGRADKYAARAFLGKAYMYGTSKDPAKAKEQFDIVVANKTLAPCLKDIFQMSTENHQEVLFAVQASINDGGNANNGNWLNQLAFPGGGGDFSCCGFHQPSQNLVNAYKVDANGLPLLDTFNDADVDAAADVGDVLDPRIDLTIGRDNVPFLDWGVHAPNWIRDRAFSGPYSPKKFMHYQQDPASEGGWNNNATSAVNFPVIRLADIMLLLAEAEIMLGNDLGRAEELVNAIRVRAGACAQGPLVEGAGDVVITNNLSDAGITWATYKVEPYPNGTFAAGGADFAMKALRFERRLELALEGHRMFDLRRWDYDEPGYAAGVLNTYVAKAKLTRSYYNDAVPYEAKHEWYPIPTTQINANTVGGEQILKQNQGW